MYSSLLRNILFCLISFLVIQVSAETELELYATTGNCTEYANLQQQGCEQSMRYECEQRFVAQNINPSESMIDNCIREPHNCGEMWSRSRRECTNYSAADSQPASSGLSFSGPGGNTSSFLTGGQPQNYNSTFSQGCRENYIPSSGAAFTGAEVICTYQQGAPASGPIVDPASQNAGIRDTGRESEGDPLEGPPPAGAAAEVTGDVDGDGLPEVGLDQNGNGVLDSQDPLTSDPQPDGSDQAAAEVTGDIDGDGLAEVGLDQNGNGVLDSQDPLTSDPQPNGTNTAAAGLPDDIQAQIDRMNTWASNQRLEFDSQCKAKKDRAETCCGDEPAACLSEAFGTDRDKNNLGVQALNMIAQGSMAMSGSIGQLCGRMKSVATAATVINGALGATCARMVGQCKNACGDFQERAERERNTLVDMLAAASPSLPYSRVRTNLEPFEHIYNGANKHIETCKIADNGTVRAAMAAYSTAQAAKMSDMCRDASTTGEGLDNIGENAFDVNCAAPGAAANPVCQAQCQRPGAEQDPICQAILGNLTGGRQAVNFGTGEGSGTGDGFDTGGLLEDDQVPNIVGGDPTSSGVATASPGGGGGLSGGGGGPSGGGGGPAAAGADRNGGPKSILKGTSSGNGYTRGALRTGASGGYRGPASTGSAGVYKKGKKFSLKDFLPGGKANPKRGLAGFSRGNPQIGAKTDDIFKRISARFYQICLNNRLYDCKTITNKRGR